MPFVTQVACCQ